MSLAQLDAHILTLITLETTESPLLSCYISRDSTTHHALCAVERRARAMRECLRDEDRKPFEDALGQIRGFLADRLHATTRGVAAFSRFGSRPFFLGLQFQVPLRNRLSVNPAADICHLAEIKDTYHRYVVLVATESWTRILEISLGATTQELWALRPDLCDRLDTVAAQKAHPGHPRVQSERFLAETIDVLERLMSSGGHTHLILAGDPELATQLRDRLPRRVDVGLVDVVPALASASLPSVIAAARSRFIEREQQESLDAVAQLVRDLRRGGPAAAGTGPTLKALRRGEAGVLVMAKAYASSHGWSCWACGFVAEGPVRPVSCPECESANVRPANLKEEIVRLAKRLSAEVEFVSHSDVLMELGGVGCLLRHGT